MLRKELFGYQIIDHLGDGAGSSIYSVTHPKTRQIFALKYVVRTDDRSLRFLDQLDNEFDVSQHVRHPLLRRVADRHVTRSMMLRVSEAAIVMEMVDGRPLDDGPPRPLSQTLAVFQQTAEALQALHSAGYVHCDLKPANILVGPAGRVKVIDLGQACKIGTAKARIQGTPDYISPEQVKCLPVTPQTDVYNFGATFYFALTAQKMPTLFTLNKGENSFLVDSQLRTPADLNPFVPQTLSNFVMECVRTNAAKRPADMATIISRLGVLQQVVSEAEAARSSVA